MGILDIIQLRANLTETMYSVTYVTETSDSMPYKAVPSTNEHLSSYW